MDYKEIELSEVITDIAAGPFGSNLKVSCFVDEGFPIIDGANLKGFKVTDNVTKFVTEEKARSLHRSIAKRNDVVVTISGTLGQIAYIPYDSMYEEYLCSQRQFRVTFDTSRVYVPYLVFYFHTYEGQSKILSFANQVGVPALSQPLKNFKAIKIKLPTLDEQIKIAEVIEIINGKIENNNKISENLLEQARCIFRNNFIDLKPYDGQMPKDWKILKLNDVSIMSAGGDKPQNVSPVPTDKLNVPIYSNGIADEGLYGYTDVAKINEESVTVSARGTIGYVCLRQMPYVPIVRLISLVPKKEFVSAKYLYHWLDAIHITGTGTTQQQLTVPNFKTTPITVPSFETMQEFTDCVSPIYEEIFKNKKQNLSLAELQELLLERLVSGKLDVAELEM